MSTAAATGRSDSDTVDLLDRMLTQLALCDDPKLEPLLSKLLPLALSTLSSQSTAVRNKVLEILKHVNIRVKDQPEIGLPLQNLWKLYLDSSAAPMIRNFCIVYIEMAFDRVGAKEKEDMTPLLVQNISKLSPQHQDIILRIAAKVIGECHASQIDEHVVTKYRSFSISQDMELFVDFCLHLLLYQPSQSGACPPGLSYSQSNRVTGKNTLRMDVLLTMKLGILNVIEAIELPPELVYPLYLAASADIQEPVIKRGEQLLKKKAAGANLDDPNLLKKLFTLLNGSIAVESIAPETRVVPGSVALKIKLMTIFCRSITAANSFPATLQSIFTCIYGSGTTSRLKQMGMEFTVWVFKHAKIEQLKLMGPVILSGILKLLDGYSHAESDTAARETKTFCFQAIGLLAQRLPHLFRDKVDMAVRLFDALKMESQSLRSVIQEATNSLAAAYKGASTAVLVDLETLLQNNCQAEQNEVRFCTLRWATSLFDLQHCPSRFICMLGVADSRLDIRELALESLFPVKDEKRITSQDLDIKYPRLQGMLDYICKQQPKLLDSSEVGEHSLLFPSEMYVVMIRFLLKCFESELKQNSTLGGSSEFLSTVEKMCTLLEHGMAYEGSVELHATASKTIVTVSSFLPQIMAIRYAHRLSWLRQFLNHIDQDTRESVARLLGIASSALPIGISSDLIQELLSSVNKSHNARFEVQYGTLSALGYITADCASRIPTMEEPMLQDVLRCLTNVANSESPVLASIAMQALGHIGLRVPLPPIPDNDRSVHVLEVLHEKLRKLLSGDDTKAIQRIVISLGHMCMREKSPSTLNTALELTFTLCRSKVEDVLFAAGEALSFLWGGVPVTADVILKTNYSSLSTSSNFLLADISSSFSDHNASSGNDANVDDHVTVRDSVTKKLFNELLYSSRKEERCSGTVWLLSLTMYCGHHPSIQKILPEIQEAFSHLLGEQHELTQELASQGMSVVYDLGDASMKKSLVDALVGTLTGSGKRKRAIKLEGDTEIFHEGTIGESPTGGKLSTYKELCSLATEMGQPDLVFKFMDLANHQASLNSKRGAAFGFSKIAKQAGDALQPHLRLLIPRLIRYQYDPDKNVQDAMSHIWKSLVAEPKPTIDKYLDVIIDDLISQCGSRLWRSREASCLALADIIQGRPYNQVGKHLKEIWTVAFRAMDDIKETVRNAGDKLCRAATTLTLRLCDISLTEVIYASKAMEIVLPLLLTEGILSKVDSVRKASIGIVMKLAKGAGVALRPHLPDLICCMLESLSSLEDQGLNYVELHAANVGIQTEKLESLRISIARSSPMWETLDLCVNVLNAESLDLLVPRLAQLVRSGVGLNTRVGVASFISLLVPKVGAEIKPYTNMLMRLLFPVVQSERSIAAKRAFASACAIVLKHTGSSHAQKLIEDTVALHTGDKNAQISCAVLLKSYSSMASDVMSGYHATVFPIIFISRFEDDKHISGIYEELWEDSTSGERVTLQLYLEEIVSLVSEGLASSSWAGKRKSAQAISKLTDVLGESLSSHYRILLESLMKELPSRLWEGKDALLHAIGALSTACHNAISSENPATANDILSIVSSACTKKSKKYREAAFSALDQVIKAFGYPEFFNVIFPTLSGMCNSAAANKSAAAPKITDAAKAEPDDGEESSVPVDKVLSCIMSAVHVANVDDILQQRANLIQVLLVSFSPGFQWIVKMAAFPLIKELCSRLDSILNDSRWQSQHESITSLVKELFHSISPKIVECIATVKIGQVHIAASDCLVEMSKLVCWVSALRWGDVGYKEELLHQYEVEKNQEAKSYLKKCIDMFE
ncbi:Proteasome adapter and scaffold protein ECM29 [Linum perenne]